MREVAAVAGVSLSTVSRVVNGVDVDPELARRVHDAVALLGYRRDLTASTLRRADRVSATIGLLIEDVANPFFSALQRSVEDVAVARHVLTFAGSSDEDPARERQLVEALLARGVTGRGSGIAVSLFDGLADWMTVPLLHQDYGGRAPKRVGINHASIAPYGAYATGDAITWGGSLWIALRDNTEKPESGDAWQLAVKKGRDGRDGVIKPDKPTMSTFSLLAVSRIFAAGTITPRSMTS